MKKINTRTLGVLIAAAATALMTSIGPMNKALAQEMANISAQQKSTPSQVEKPPTFKMPPSHNYAAVIDSVGARDALHLLEAYQKPVSDAMKYFLEEDKKLSNSADKDTISVYACDLQDFTIRMDFIIKIFYLSDTHLSQDEQKLRDKLADQYRRYFEIISELNAKWHQRAKELHLLGFY